MTKGEAFNESVLFLGLSTKNGWEAGTLYAQKPSDGTGDFVCDRNSSAYRLSQDGVMELMAIDTPRVDYTNTCPELLIEGARTNKLLQSETFNTSWIVEKLTITTNAVSAPNGLTVANSLVPTAVSGVHRVQQSVAVVGQVGTMYVYAKANGYNWIALENGGQVAYFNISTGTVGTVSGGTASIRLINGFYQCIFTCTALNTKSNIFVASANNTITFTGNGINGVYLWGSQFELGSNATSYIPTTTTSVTRVRDIVTNSTIDYTGLTGTIFVRARVEDSTFVKDDTILSLWGNFGDSYLLIYTDKDRNLIVQTYENPDINTYTYALASDGIYSIAVGYDFSGANNNLNIAVNGVLKRANSAQVNNPPLVLDILELGNLNGVLPQIENRIIGSMWFDTQLSDTDLTALTVQ